ncbi:hypothetical protein C4D60_Mb08t14180 [Musa balbisiana]|uniref:Uncharacterized protein n=1 Tax=Musa balbisiana TaxID=52838 RepID=A0A4S8K3N6_MUSBA|nr:hypothetical protein C4D60_Mb08t14180 [Musa balbisiana]
MDEDQRRTRACVSSGFSDRLQIRDSSLLVITRDNPNNEVISHSFLQMAWEHRFRIYFDEVKVGGKGAAVYLRTKKTKSSNLRISACLSARARRGEARAPRVCTRQCASMRRHLGAHPNASARFN